MTITKQGPSRMLKGLLTFPAFALPLAFAATAAAQDAKAASASANCPPGSWFCADAPPPAPAATPQPAAPQPLQPLPAPASEEPARPAPPVAIVQPAPAPPPVVVYQPAPPVMVVQPRSDVPPRYDYVPRDDSPFNRRKEWGLNLHLMGAILGSKAPSDSGMGGLGLGLRFKPNPHFGVEGSLDFLSGRDYNDMSRSETAFSLNGLIFVNPKSRAQLYFVGGVGWSGAHVTQNWDSNQFPTTGGLYSSHYSYFGGQGGVGVEFRVAKHLAFNIDVRGFIRGRTDSNAAATPEFRDPTTGQTTNTSGGGLVQGGMTFYF